MSYLEDHYDEIFKKYSDEDLIKDIQSYKRVTANYQENNWGKIMNGHPILDKAMSLMTV